MEMEMEMELCTVAANGLQAEGASSSSALSSSEEMEFLTLAANGLQADGASSSTALSSSEETVSHAFDLGRRPLRIK
jgi:hypothetical protein